MREMIREVEIQRYRESNTHLHVTFCDVERRNAGVGETTRKGTTEHTLGVVAGIVGDGAQIPVRSTNEQR